MLAPMVGSPRECRFCGGQAPENSPCSQCGGLDEVAPLETFLRLREVDRDLLLEFVNQLQDPAPSTADLGLRACAFLSMRQFQEALPALRGACRGEPLSSPVRQLTEELDQRLRGEALAHALLARERGELGNKKIILSVDDSATVRRVLELAFTRAGHVVVSVEDAEKALTALSEVRPDIVFVDFQLPGLDGLGLCRRIRKERTTRDIPVVILSGTVGSEVMGLTRRAGANSFVKKPASPEILLGLLSELTTV